MMVGTDAYLAAQRGVVDGVFCAWGSYNVWNLKEVTTYHTMLGLCPGQSFWFINKDTWDRFTPHEQELIMAYRYQGPFQGSRANVWQVIEITAPIPQENFIYLSQEDTNEVKKLFEPSWLDWADRMEAMGYPGHDILEDFIVFLDVYSYS